MQFNKCSCKCKLDASLRSSVEHRSILIQSFYDDPNNSLGLGISYDSAKERGY